MRTEKGPQRSGFTNSVNPTPRCRCGQTQTGKHLTFDCPLGDGLRHQLIGQRKEWAGLGGNIWIQNGPEKEDITEGGEEWFQTIYNLLATPSLIS